MLARHFEGAALSGLLSLMDRMTEAQIGQVVDRIGADNSRVDDVLVGQFQLQMFACQEETEINSAATLPEASAMLRSEFGWPEALTAALEAGMIAGFYGPCEEFTRHPRPGMDDPVTADIPTLVMQGWLDTQTAPSWGALMVCLDPAAGTAGLPPGIRPQPGRVRRRRARVLRGRAVRAPNSGAGFAKRIAMARGVCASLSHRKFRRQDHRLERGT